MKKLIITFVVLGALGLGYYKLSTLRIDFASLRGETKVVGRGDLTIPINATGKVAPLARHVIKSEASGEVIEITREPGDLVGSGDLLVRLKKDNEQRSVDRAKAEVTRSRATLERAKIKSRQLKTVGLDKARFRRKQIEANVEMSEFTRNKTEALDKDGRATPDELMRVRTNHDDLSARLEQAKADEIDAAIAVELADQDVILAEAVYDQAVATLGDATERLSETDIYSPVDGLVVQVNTQVGEVIQGGKSTFTAGTILAVVADVSKLYVRTEVDEADIGVVRELAPESARPGRVFSEPIDVPIETGTEVTVRVESFRDEEFTGIIERIHPEPNSVLSSIVTYQVDILLTSDNRHKLLLGMQADVEFTAESAYDVVLVPHEAIRRNEFGELGVYEKVSGETPDGKEPEPKFRICRLGLDNGI